MGLKFSIALNYRTSHLRIYIYLFNIVKECDNCSFIYIYIQGKKCEMLHDHYPPQTVALSQTSLKRDILFLMDGPKSYRLVIHYNKLIKLI